MYPSLSRSYDSGKSLIGERAKLMKNLQKRWEMTPAEFPYFEWAAGTMTRLKDVNSFINRIENRDTKVAINRLARSIVWRAMAKESTHGPAGEHLGPANSDFNTKGSVWKNKEDVDKIDMEGAEVRKLLRVGNKVIDERGFIIDLPGHSRGSDLSPELQLAPRGQLPAAGTSRIATAPPTRSVGPEHFPIVPADADTQRPTRAMRTARANSPSSPPGRPGGAGLPAGRGVEAQLTHRTPPDKGGAARRPDSAAAQPEIEDVCERCRYNPAAGIVAYLERSKYELASQDALDNIVIPYGDVVAMYENEFPAEERHGLSGLPVCLRHFKVILGSLGFRTNRTTNIGQENLRYVHKNIATVAQLRSWMTGHPDSFTALVLPQHYLIARANLGPYRFFAEPVEVHDCFTDEEAEHLANISGLKREIGIIRERGSVIIPDMFAWTNVNSLEDEEAGLPTINQLMMEEMDMYLWHQRRVSGKHNLGWLRNMIHSNMQQLVRQDVHY
jgi:hypothetical protein